MAYQIKGDVIINDVRALIGVSTAGINTALYVGDSAANLITLDGETGNIDVSGTSALDGNVTLGGNLSFVGATAEENISGITTDLEVSAGATELATAEGIKTYVDDRISETGGTLNFGSDSGSGAVDLSSQTFSIEGTNLEIETSAVNQTLTIGLTNDVSIGGSMTANKYFGDGSELTGITGSNVNLDNTDQTFNTLILTEGSGPNTGYGLTVISDAQIKGHLVMEGQIHGPSTFVIDPEVIGNNTGTVIIRGDLVVEGEEFIINSETLQIADKQIGLATNVTNAALLEDSGITIGAAGSSIEQSFLWDFSSQSFQSSAGLGVTTGGGFYSGDNEVLNLTTLGSTVLASSLTSVGTLTDLTVAGDITANGDIVGDTATNISGINSVTATDFYGNGSGLTGINAGSVNLDDTSQDFLNLNISATTGVGLTVVSNVEIGGNLFFTGADADENFTGITTDLNESSGATEAVTAAGVKAYVDGSVGAANQLKFTGNTGETGDIDLANEELSITGTVNQVVTNVPTADGEDLTISLSSTLVLPGSLAFTGADSDENFTGITTDLNESSGANEAVTAAGVVAYVGEQVGTNSVLTIEDGSANTGTIALGSQNLVFNGTANEVEVLVGGTPGKLTIGLPDDVTISNNLIVTTNFSFDGGQAVDEISIDGTLADDSDTAIPTEKAVRTYVDAQVSGGGGSSASILTADNQDNTAYSVSFVSATGAGSSVYTDENQLNYNPSTGVLQAKDFNSLSDIRFKDNVETIGGAVAKLQQLRGVEFDWKNSPGSSVGVIAQEVKEVYPQLVTESEEKITVNYNGLVGLLIQAVKEQADEIAALKEKLG